MSSRRAIPRPSMLETHRAVRHATALLHELCGEPKPGRAGYDEYTIPDQSMTVAEAASLFDRLEAARELMRLHARAWKRHAKTPREFRIAEICNGMADTFVSALNQLTEVMTYEPGGSPR